MKVEKIIKREDGSKIKLELKIEMPLYSYQNDFQMAIACYKCAPRKRTWDNVCNSIYLPVNYRSCSMEEKERIRNGIIRQYVSDSELEDIKKMAIETITSKIMNTEFKAQDYII